MRYLLENLSSERLDFRSIVPDDFDLWLPFFYDRSVLKYYPFPSDISDEILCEEWLERQFLRYKEERGGFNALIERESGTMIGHCGLLVQEIDNHSELEVGYALLPSYRGFGYASEAARFCKETAFNERWSSSLISIIHPENLASQNVAARNGMDIEKISEFHSMDYQIWRVYNEVK